MPYNADLRGRSVLALHAHPDDEAIFTGLTLRRLADAGARVVLVLATAGDLGQSRVPLRSGESITQRRTAELERSAELLGVSRLVLLGRRDSGLPGWSSMLHPRALAGADPFPLAQVIAELAEAEGADTLLYDDESGIYGHPDHSAVHLIGATAAAMSGAAGYRTTVAHDVLHEAAPDRHLVHGAARAAEVSFGRPSTQIELSVTGSVRELEAKYRAIIAHASQIGPEDVPRAEFGTAYGTEWFVRENRPGLLDELPIHDRAPLGAAV